MGLIYIYGYQIYLSKTTSLSTIIGISRAPYDSVLKNIKTGVIIKDGYKCTQAYNNYVLCAPNGQPLA
jgi:hypothetical protein